MRQSQRSLSQPSSPVPDLKRLAKEETPRVQVEEKGMTKNAEGSHSKQKVTIDLPPPQETPKRKMDAKMVAKLFRRAVAESKREAESQEEKKKKDKKLKGSIKSSKNIDGLASVLSGDKRKHKDGDSSSISSYTSHNLENYPTPETEELSEKEQAKRKKMLEKERRRRKFEKKLASYPINRKSTKRVVVDSSDGESLADTSEGYKSDRKSPKKLEKEPSRSQLTKQPSKAQIQTGKPHTPPLKKQLTKSQIINVGNKSTSSGTPKLVKEKSVNSTPKLVKDKSASGTPKLSKHKDSNRDSKGATNRSTPKKSQEHSHEKKKIHESAEFESHSKVLAGLHEKERGDINDFYDEVSARLELLKKEIEFDELETKPEPTKSRCVYHSPPRYPERSHSVVKPPAVPKSEPPVPVIVRIKNKLSSNKKPVETYEEYMDLNIELDYPELGKETFGKTMDGSKMSMSSTLDFMSNSSSLSSMSSVHATVQPYKRISREHSTLFQVSEDDESKGTALKVAEEVEVEKKESPPPKEAKILNGKNGKKENHGKVATPEEAKIAQKEIKKSEPKEDAMSRAKLYALTTPAEKLQAFETKLAAAKQRLAESREMDPFREILRHSRTNGDIKSKNEVLAKPSANKSENCVEVRKPTSDVELVVIDENQVGKITRLSGTPLSKLPRLVEDKVNKTKKFGALPTNSELEFIVVDENTATTSTKNNISLESFEIRNSSRSTAIRLGCTSTVPPEKPKRSAYPNMGTLSFNSNRFGKVEMSSRLSASTRARIDARQIEADKAKFIKLEDKHNTNERALSKATSKCDEQIVSQSFHPKPNPFPSSCDKLSVQKLKAKHAEESESQAEDLLNTAIDEETIESGEFSIDESKIELDTADDESIGGSTPVKKGMVQENSPEHLVIINMVSDLPALHPAGSVKNNSPDYYDSPKLNSPLMRLKQNTPTSSPVHKLEERDKLAPLPVLEMSLKDFRSSFESYVPRISIVPATPDIQTPMTPNYEGVCGVWDRFAEKIIEEELEEDELECGLGNNSREFGSNTSINSVCDEDEEVDDLDAEADEEDDDDDDDDDMIEEFVAVVKEAPGSTRLGFVAKRRAMFDRLNAEKPYMSSQSYRTALTRIQQSHIRCRPSIDETIPSAVAEPVKIKKSSSLCDLNVVVNQDLSTIRQCTSDPNIFKLEIRNASSADVNGNLLDSNLQQSKSWAVLPDLASAENGEIDSFAEIRSSKCPNFQTPGFLGLHEHVLSGNSSRIRGDLGRPFDYSEMPYLNGSLDSDDEEDDDDLPNGHTLTEPDRRLRHEMNTLAGKLPPITEPVNGEAEELEEEEISSRSASTVDSVDATPTKNHLSRSSAKPGILAMFSSPLKTRRKTDNSSTVLPNRFTIFGIKKEVGSGEGSESPAGSGSPSRGATWRMRSRNLFRRTTEKQLANPQPP